MLTKEVEEQEERVDRSFWKGFSAACAISLGVFGTIIQLVTDDVSGAYLAGVLIVLGACGVGAFAWFDIGDKR